MCTLVWGAREAGPPTHLITLSVRNAVLVGGEHTLFATLIRRTRRLRSLDDGIDFLLSSVKIKIGKPAGMR